MVYVSLPPEGKGGDTSCPPQAKELKSPDNHSECFNMYPEVGGMGQVPNLAGGGGGVGKKRTGSELNFKNCLGIPQLNISIE